MSRMRLPIIRDRRVLIVLATATAVLLGGLWAFIDRSAGEPDFPLAATPHEAADGTTAGSPAVPALSPTDPSGTGSHGSSTTVDDTGTSDDGSGTTSDDDGDPSPTTGDTPSSTPSTPSTPSSPDDPARQRVAIGPVTFMVQDADACLAGTG